MSEEWRENIPFLSFNVHISDNILFSLTSLSISIGVWSKRPELKTGRGLGPTGNTKRGVDMLLLRHNQQVDWVPDLLGRPDELTFQERGYLSLGEVLTAIWKVGHISEGRFFFFPSFTSTKDDALECLGGEWECWVGG